MGLAFYNNVLIPIGLLLLMVLAATPLLRWGSPPGATPKKLLAMAAVVGLIVAAAALAAGVHRPLALTVAGLAGFAVVSTAAAWSVDFRARHSQRSWNAPLAALFANRRRYAAYPSTWASSVLWR